MANLIRVTTTKANRLINGVGSYSINTSKIKKVSALGTGSLIYYYDGAGKSSALIKIEVAEPPITINSALTGSLDIQIPVNVLTIDGANHVVTENIKTTEIIYGKIDSNVNYTMLWILEAGVTKEYKVNNTLSSIETAANNYTIGGVTPTWGDIVGNIQNQTDLKNIINPLVPLNNQTFSGQFNLSTNYEVYYNTYTTNTTVTPTVSSIPLVGAVARVVFDAGASASLTATNLGTLRAGSDTFTISKLNEILVFSLPEGLEYSIKVLN